MLVFGNAQNDLEPEIIEDLIEMESIGSTDEVQIVAQLNRGPRPQNRAEDEAPLLDGSWHGMRRYRVEAHAPTHQPRIQSPVLESGPMQNLGEPQALADFIRWGMEKFPSRRTMVIVGDHGQGHLGTGFDYVHDDVLQISELEEALDRGGLVPDLLIFDACQMSQLEVAYQLRDEATLMIGSEEILGRDGLPHSEILGWLSANPTATSNQLAEVAVEFSAFDQIMRWENDEPDAAAQLAAIDLSQMEALAASVDAMVATLEEAQLPRPLLRRLVEDTQTFNAYGNPSKPDTDFRDLGHFCAGLVEAEWNSSSRVKQAAKQVLAQLETAVIATQNEGYEADEATGLSVYLPEDGRLEPSYASQEFSLNTRWDEWLKKTFSESL